MQIFDFKVTTTANPSNTIIYGTSFTVAFTVLREAGDVFNDELTLWLPSDTSEGELLMWYESDFSLAVGQRKEMEFTTFPLTSAPLAAILEQQRAVRLDTWGIQFGVFGSRVNADFPVNVVKGWLPRIESFSALRTIDGVEDDEGECLMCGLKLSTGGSADLSGMFLRMHYSDQSVSQEAPYIDLTSAISDGLTGIEDSLDLVTETFSNGTSWQLALVFGDDYENAVASFDVPSAFANVHLSGCRTGGVAFGKFSAATEGSPKFECEYPAVFNAPVTFNNGVSGIPRIEYGFIEGMQNISSNAYRDFAVTFQTAYQNPPVVMCNFGFNGTAGGFGRFCTSICDISLTGCVVRVFNGDSTARNPSVLWAAIGT